jgi:dienelactone hydrolase
MMLRREFVGALAVAAIGCATAGPRGRKSWADRRAGFKSQLRERGPAPGKWKPQTVPEGVREVRYEGATGGLLAWFAAPAGARKAPALVYFHGEFSFAAWDFEQVRPFLNAGFAVMTPALRGENGNPGDFELLMGEVDDGAAAVRWLAQQPEVDASRIHTLGHSVGGGVSGLLSLVPDLPVAVTASVGGVYSRQTFQRWAKYEDTRSLVRFDPTNVDEVELRVLGENLADMQRPHRAYVGLEDAGILDNARALEKVAGKAPFTLTTVPGDHAKSLQPGIAAYLRDLTGG